MEERSISPRTREGMSERSADFEREALRLAAKHAPPPERRGGAPVREVPHCASCVFFVPYPAVPSMGECHQASPFLKAVGQHSRTAWPQVSATEFCGDHPDWPRPEA